MIQTRGKIHVLILDGAADRPIPELGGQTPLEAAHTPALDSLARAGVQGLVPVIPRVAPESDCGCMAWLGYDPHEYYTGRGPLEGLGLGFLDAAGSTVCFRCNFASWDAASATLLRRTARALSDDDLQELAGEIADRVCLRADSPVEFGIKAFGRYRGIFYLRSAGEPLSGAVSNTDPLFIKVGPFGVPAPPSDLPLAPLRCRPMNTGRAAAVTAALVNQFVERSTEVLSRSEVNQRRRRHGEAPANLLLLRDGGEVPRVMPAFSQRFGKSVAFFGQIPAEAGLMRLVGGEYFDIQQPQSESDSAFYARTLSKLENVSADVVFAHLVKGADEAGHDRQPRKKVAAIENFDQFFLGQFLKSCAPDSIIVVTSDHATPCELGLHSDDPIPTLLAGPGLIPDVTQTFGERSAREGGLRLRQACDLLPKLLNPHGAEL